MNLEGREFVGRSAIVAAKQNTRSARARRAGTGGPARAGARTLSRSLFAQRRTTRLAKSPAARFRRRCKSRSRWPTCRRSLPNSARNWRSIFAARCEPARVVKLPFYCRAHKPGRGSVFPEAGLLPAKDAIMKPKDLALRRNARMGPRCRRRWPQGRHGRHHRLRPRAAHRPGAHGPAQGRHAGEGRRSRSARSNRSKRSAISTARSTGEVIAVTQRPGRASSRRSAAIPTTAAG